MKDMDKLLHFGICFVLSLYSTELAIGAAATKEWCDKSTEGNHWCWWDLFCDIIGIVMGTMVRMIVAGRYNWM